MSNDLILRCSKCNRKYENPPEQLKFCNDCGTAFDRAKDLKVKAKAKPKRSVDQRTVILVLGSLGIVMIGLAIINLVDIESFPISPLMLYIGGMVGFVLIAGISVLLYWRKTLGQDPVVMLLLTSEVVLLGSQFFYDLVARSEFSRYSILIASLFLSALMISTRNIFSVNAFQKIHLVLNAYFAWIIIFITAGSDYISPVVFTIVLILQIVQTNLYALRKPVLETSASFMIFQGFVLISTVTINFSFIFFVGLTIFTVIPLLLYRYPPKESQSFYLAFIPTFAGIYGVSNGALQAPYPHILLAVFALSWALYLRKSDLSKSVLGNIGMLVSAGLLFGVLVYALNFPGIEMLLFYLITITVISVFGNLIDTLYRRAIQAMSMILLFVVNWLSYLSFIDLSMSIALFFVSILIIYWNDLRTGVKTDIPLDFKYSYAFISLQLGSVLFYIGMYSKYPLLGTQFYLTYGINLAILLLVYLTMNQKSIIEKLDLEITSMQSYLLLVGGYILSTAFAYQFNEENIIFQYLGIALTLLIGAIPLLKRELMEKEMLVIGWLLLAGLQTYSANFATNNYFNNFFLIPYLAFALLSLGIKEKGSIAFMAPILLGSVGILARTMVLEEIILDFPSIGIKGINSRNISMMSAFVVYTLLSLAPVLQKTNFRDRKKVQIGYYVFLLALWLLIGIIYYGNAINNLDELLARSILVFMEIGLLIHLFLVFSKNWSISLLERIDDTQQFILYSVLLLANLILYFIDPALYSIWVAFVLIFPVTALSINLFNKIEVNLIWFISWFVMMTMSLIIIGGQSNLAMYLSIATAYLIIQTSILIFNARIKIAGYIYPLVNFAIFAVFGLVLRNLADSQIAILYAFGTWIIIIIISHVLMLWRTNRLEYELLLLSVLMSIVNMVWISQTWIMLGLVGINLVSFALNYKLLFAKVKESRLPLVNISSMSVLIEFLSFVLIIGALLINNEVIVYLSYTYALIWISLVLLIGTNLAKRMLQQSNNLIDGLILLSFFMLIVSNLISYYTSPISNAILLAIALFFSGLGLAVKDQSLFYIGMGVSGLSLFKGFIDLMILQGLDVWISLLIVGSQFVFYSVIFMGPISRIQKSST